MLARIEEFHLTPAKPLHAGVVQHPFPASLGTDMHQAFEVGILLSGEEERHFEQSVLVIKPGEIWLCGAWEPHGWRSLAPGTQELVLQFLPDFLGEETVGDVSWLSLFSATPDQRPRVTNRETRDRVLAMADEVRDEMRECHRGWLSSIRLHILRLLLVVSRDWEPPALPGRSHTVRTGNLGKIMPAVRLVHAHPTRRLSLAEAAAACGLSVSQFGHIFRRLMGLSFGKFCMRARLAYVAELLLGTDLCVGDIAQRSGFSDASHLHHAFAEVYGATPSHYRKNGQRLTDRQHPYVEIEEVGVEHYSTTAS